MSKADKKDFKQYDVRPSPTDKPTTGRDKPTIDRSTKSQAEKDATPQPGQDLRGEKQNPPVDVKPTGERRERKDDPDMFVVIDRESGALEYGPAEDEDAAKGHMGKLRALDLRGSLAEDVGRDLVVYKLVPVKEKKKDAEVFGMTRVATDRVDRNDRTSAESIGEPNVEPLLPEDAH